MKSFVLIYERSSGSLQHEEFLDPQQAFRRRLQLEQTVPAGTEVVVFRADSLGQIEKTHGRYFRSAGEIVGDIVSV